MVQHGLDVDEVAVHHYEANGSPSEYELSTQQSA